MRKFSAVQQRMRRESFFGFAEKATWRPAWQGYVIHTVKRLI